MEGIVSSSNHEPEEERCLGDGNSDANGKTTTLLIFLDSLLPKQRKM
jgi:hypothetical protein